jgi:hypothetical protein
MPAAFIVAALSLSFATGKFGDKEGHTNPLEDGAHCYSFESIVPPTQFTCSPMLDDGEPRTIGEEKPQYRNRKCTKFAADGRGGPLHIEEIIVGVLLYPNAAVLCLSARL